LILLPINDPTELPEKIHEVPTNFQDEEKIHEVPTNFQDEHNGFENTAFQISLITMPCTILTYGDSKLKNHDTINSR
jgi:hypothetical protein